MPAAAGQCIRLASCAGDSPEACDLAPVSSQSAPANTFHPAGQFSGRGVAGGAEPLTATAVSLFGLSPDS